MSFLLLASKIAGDISVSRSAVSSREIINRYYLQITEAVVSAGLIICFLFAYLAEYTGVAAIIGAYIAGVAISLTNYKHEVFEKVETISYSVFVPVFFTSNRKNA